MSKQHSDNRRNAHHAGSPFGEEEYLVLSEGHIAVARQCHIAGDPFAVDRCVLACFYSRKPFPDWLVAALVHRSRVKLGFAEEERWRGGPLANPENRIRTSQRDISIYCAVFAARELGYRGDWAFFAAEEVLRASGHEDLTSETIKKYFKRCRKRFAGAETAIQLTLNSVRYVTSALHKQGKLPKPVSMRDARR